MVTEKTNAFFIGKQDAENEVYIDRIIRQEGDRDKALLYIVHHMDCEERIQVLVNCLLNRGANPSVHNSSLKETPLHFAVRKNFKGVCKKLLDNGAWPNPRNRSGLLPLSIAMSRNNDDLASMLIMYMKNLEVRNMFSNHGSAAAEFSFHRLLQSENMEKTVLSVLNCMIDLISPDGKAKVHFHVLEADENGRAPDSDDFIEDSRSPFQIISKSGNKTIINHDAIRLLIRRKWKHYARKYFLIDATVFLMSWFCLAYAAITAVMTDDPLKYKDAKHVFRGICEGLSVIAAVATLLMEIYPMKKHGLDYFKEKINHLWLYSALFVLILVPLRLTGHPNQWQIFSVVFLLWTLRIFNFASVFRQTGAYAQILVRIVASDFVQFMVVFAVVVTVFSGTLILALKGGDQQVEIGDTRTFWGILFLGIRILIESERIIDYMQIDPWSCIVMIVFLFACIVMLLNLLIAQLSDTYQNVQQDAQRGLEANRAWIVARIELRSMHIGKGVWCRHYKSHKDIKDINKVLEKWESPPLQEINKSIHTIEDAVQTHKLNLLAVNDRLARQERTLLRIQEQLDALLRKDNVDSNNKANNIGAQAEEIADPIDV